MISGFMQIETLSYGRYLGGLQVDRQQGNLSPQNICNGPRQGYYESLNHRMVPNQKTLGVSPDDG